ncbi:Nucleolysin TIA-1 [Fasciola gigantica]|uniref:Nucleolysin TIA-1 n=1 Tax=Fasciola gigantica TaxID=46835 RepID=A0A504Z0D4_FASGI|nr:Nucleolysin TIA-1 [Fasciola gigantica]
MVHVIQTNPESPSLLTAKAFCHLGDPSATFALHAVPGLISNPSHSGNGQPVVAQSLYNSSLFNLIPNLSDHMLRSEAWLGPAQIPSNTSGVTYNSSVNTHRQENFAVEKSVSDNYQIALTQKADQMSTTVSSVNDDEKNLSDSYHIFVGDLAPDIEDDMLHAAFAAFGNVTECKIIKDMHTQKPKGYGFVAYKTKQEAERAIQIMNGQVIGSRAIRTNWAVRRDPADQARDHRPLNYIEVFNASSASNTTIYVGGITTGLTGEPNLMKLMVMGKLSKRLKVGFDFKFSLRFRFDTHAAATRAIVTMHGRLVGNQSCKCSWGKEPTFSNRLHSVSQVLWPVDSIFSPSCFSFSNPLRFPGEHASTGAALISSNASLDRLGPLHSVYSVASRGQPGIPISCELATNPLLTDTGSIPLHGLQPMTPGLVTLKSLQNKALLPTYPFLSNVTSYIPNGPIPISLPSTATKFNLCDGTMHNAFSLNSLDPVGYALRNQNLMSIPISLTDWTTNAPSFGCGFIQPEIPRPALISNCNGVSLLC